jgi:type II secretory pathway pseudopilin PulG
MIMTLRNPKGVTVIELLVALVMSSLIVGAIYWTYVRQQKSYSVQEQVIDIQQNARTSFQQMVREIRLAGFGNIPMILPATFSSGTYNNVVNPNTPAANAVTIVAAIQEAGSLTATGDFGANQITISKLTDGLGNPLFDTADLKYVAIGGVESHVISAVDNDAKTLTLTGPLIFRHAPGTPVFGVRAVTYQIASVDGKPVLMRNTNVGFGDEPVSDNIENLQFQYCLTDGSWTSAPAKPADIRVVQFSVRARTDEPDPDFKENAGYRKRQFATSVHIKNMGIEP